MTYLFFFSVLLLLSILFFQLPFWNAFFSYSTKQTPLTDEERKKLHLYLISKFPFYANLTEEGQQKFKDRLNHFKQTHYFTGKQELAVTPEMETLVSAAAIAITFAI